ncbi:MAG TPA: hypothetical protein VK327_18215 [Candidatus Paceibacterota bacterium]|nr:hypothetical protein [Candidatus Paceibacterota bacterium]
MSSERREPRWPNLTENYRILIPLVVVLDFSSVSEDEEDYDYASRLRVSNHLTEQVSAIPGSFPEIYLVPAQETA